MSRKKLHTGEMWAVIDPSTDYPFFVVEWSEDEARYAAIKAYGMKPKPGQRAWELLVESGLYAAPVSVREVSRKRSKRGKR